jgi:hypothetical protein
MCKPKVEGIFRGDFCSEQKLERKHKKPMRA